MRYEAEPRNEGARKARKFSALARNSKAANIRAMSSGTGQSSVGEAARSEKSADVRRAESIGALLDAKTTAAPRQTTNPIYFYETRRPLVCLLFLLPLMLWYEIGKLLLPVVAGGLRPAPGIVESWLMWASGETGLVLAVLIPILSVGMLLFLHHQQKEAFSISLNTFAGMFAEVVGLAVMLFLVGDAILLFVESQQPQPLSHLADLFLSPKWHAVLLESLGAGLHEEFLFRLMLFGGAFAWLKWLIDDELIALLISAVVVSLLFAFAHCEVIGHESVNFRPSVFLLRFLASVALCLLFRYRGFAIAVGVHVGFNILASA